MEHRKKLLHFNVRNLYKQYKYGLQAPVIDPTPLMNNLQGKDTHNHESEQVIKRLFTQTISNRLPYVLG